MQPKGIDMKMERNKEIIGREYEQRQLEECLESDSAQFVAVYGRRRVGKTFLVKKFFADRFDFYVSGVYGISMKEQLDVFADQLSQYSRRNIERPENWFEAFRLLRDYLGSLQKDKWVVFIDELPWFDTPKSNFIRALEAFWNMWGSDHKQLLLIVCGSATTWMINTLLGDKGGLHNRVTRRIHLYPFNLGETEEYLLSKGIDWDRLHILQCYMTVGGIPYYLSLIKKEESMMQNTDRLFFGRDAILRDEYNFVFKSLFNDSVAYRRVLELLATKMSGYTRNDIISDLRITGNGTLTEILNNLCACDFITPYSTFGKRSNDIVYKLSDHYLLFYLRFVKNYLGKNPKAWSEMKDQARSTWYGYAFEQVCLYHVWQIKESLGIRGIDSSVSSWSYKAKSPEEKGAQIDLVIQRADRMINLCEIKFSTKPYEITADYSQQLSYRKELFRTKTKCRDTLLTTVITTFGVARNKYSNYVQSEIVLDDLFRKER